MNKNKKLLLIISVLNAVLLLAGVGCIVGGVMTKLNGYSTAGFLLAVAAVVVFFSTAPLRRRNVREPAEDEVTAILENGKKVIDKNRKLFVVLLVLAVLSGALLLAGIGFMIVGIVTGLRGFLITGPILFAGALCAFFGVVLPRLKKNREERSNHTKILDAYRGMADYGEPGYVTFINEGLKFSATGKYACVKDFNGVPGYHLAFRIEGTKLISKPENYDDSVGYEDCLFTIELAYFDGVKLSQPENDNGIVVGSISELVKGKKLRLSNHDGYMATISTAETDDIDCGDVTIEQWDDDARIIRFLLLAPYGLNDVIAGRVALTEDTEE